MDRQSLRAGSALIGGPTKAFELPLPNMLWMSDCMHGPKLQSGDGQKLRTFLFALIDDCTRLRVLRIYDRLNQITAIQFIDYVLEKLPFRVDPS